MPSLGERVLLEAIDVLFKWRFYYPGTEKPEEEIVRELWALFSSSESEKYCPKNGEVEH
jgi:hypothetical protein